MIDIEIQISISERSSGWAINYGGTNLFFLCSNKKPESHSGAIIGELSFLPGGVVTGGRVGGLNLGWWR